MPRLFVAVDLPDEVVEHLDRLCVGLPSIRWASRDQFHLTIRFIGEVDHPVFYEIGEGLAEITARPFELRLKGMGLFPPRGTPHTLWAGVEDDSALAPLKRRIDRVVEAAGAEPDRRRFAPHVTLGRFRDAPPEARFGSWLAARSLFRSEAFTVGGFTLYSSHLRPEGALHTAEASYNFVNGVMERV